MCNTLATNPFHPDCDINVPEIREAQFLACTTGARPDNLPVTAADCNHAFLSGFICNDNINLDSPADPFAQICTDAAITIKQAADTIAARATIRAFCEPLVNAGRSVCMARTAQLARLDPVCIRTNEDDLFGARCKDYAEYRDFRALACRERPTGSTLTCDTAEIRALVCTAGGVEANPFDTICSPATSTYAGARTLFASRCARDNAKDPRAISGLKGADCSNTGLNSAGLNSDCLDDPFDTGCAADEDYEIARSDRRIACRDDINTFEYNCFGAIENVCGGTSINPAAPTNAALFKDKLCTDSSLYNPRRTAIVAACNMVKTTAPGDMNCIVEAATGINIISCIDNPYQVECAAAAFGDRRTAVLGDCDITTLLLVCPLRV